MLVLVALPHLQAEQLRSGVAVGDLPGCAATSALVNALGPDASIEEVEFAALSNAGVLALLGDGGPVRLVLAADVGEAQVVDQQADDGQVVVSGLRWSQVQALFADESEAAEAVVRARAAVGQAELGDALADPAVADLLNSYDLLWYSPEELDGLA